MLKLSYLQQIIDNSCMHFNDISAKDWGNYSFNGESCQTHVNVKDGMSTVANKLYEKLKAHIKFKKIVNLVNWKKEADYDNPTTIDVLCEDGTILKTNNLICTIPLGRLNKRQHFELFSPPLPKEHRDVIDNIGFGTIDKIFLHFNERWWNSDWKGLQLIWKDELNDVSTKSFQFDLFLFYQYF
jgi:spermine oxidase